MARKPRNLSPEDKELWSRVARATNPLKRSAKPALDLTPPPKTEAKPQAKKAIPKFRLGETAADKPQTRIDLAPAGAVGAQAAKVNMDSKTYKKLSRGRLKPEARIDLHGMTLATAQPALNRFILDSHAAGRRLVLVITGKGRTGVDQGGPIPERRGILRHQVPQWLALPPLNTAVLQVTKAHISHGGDGAYYVYLKRARR